MPQPQACKICRKPVVEQSMFCREHFAQARSFAAAFGAKGDATGSDNGDAGTDPDPAPVKLEGPLGSISESYEAVVGKSSEEERRWPQISLYFRDDNLVARAYYSVIPPPEGDTGAGRASLQKLADEYRKALEPQSAPGVAIVESFKKHEQELLSGELQTLDVHFLTYARLLAINIQRPNRTLSNLATFELAPGGFQPVNLDEVRDRLRHDRW